MESMLVGSVGAGGEARMEMAMYVLVLTGISIYYLCQTTGEIVLFVDSGSLCSSTATEERGGLWG